MRSRAAAGSRSCTSDDEGLDDLILGEIPLAEDRQDVLDPGPGRLAEDVLPPDAMRGYPAPGIDVSQCESRVLVSAEQRPGLDDLGRVTCVRFAGLGLNSLGSQSIHVCPLARSRIDLARVVFSTTHSHQGPAD